MSCFYTFCRIFIPILYEWGMKLIGWVPQQFLGTMWVQLVPVTAIPWGRMKTEQHNLVIRSIRTWLVLSVVNECIYIPWSLAMRRVENEMMSMKLVAWGMKTWPLGMKYHVQGTKCLCFHLRLVKAPRRVPCPMVGHLKHSFFGLSQPAREGHHVLSQLFDWQRFIYHLFYCSNGSW
jgi:hypothetical protein